METSPASGVTSPTSSLNSVVLPDPFAPISPMRSPRSTREVQLVEQTPLAEGLLDVGELNYRHFIQ